MKGCVIIIHGLAHVFALWEDLCANPGIGVNLVSVSGQLCTVLLFRWTVWCVRGSSVVSVSVCERFRANVDVICTFGSVFNVFSSVDLFLSGQDFRFFPLLKGSICKQKQSRDLCVCVNVTLTSIKTCFYIWFMTFCFIHTKLNELCVQSSAFSSFLKNLFFFILFR